MLMNYTKTRNNNVDLRVEKTRKLIIDTYRRLLEMKDIEAITVKELSEKARINKSTFYRHFQSLDSLITLIEDEVATNFMTLIADYKIPEQLAEINRAFFIFSETNDTIYEKLIFHKNYEYIKIRTINKVMDRIWKKSSFYLNLPQHKQSILLTFVKTTGVEIYKQWVQDNKRIPLEDVIYLSNRILCDGIQVFLENKK
ncbi:TetR/AcrR family transcriptional regulator [Streptococcus suis]